MFKAKNDYIVPFNQEWPPPCRLCKQRQLQQRSPWYTPCARPSVLRASGTRRALYLDLLRLVHQHSYLSHILVFSFFDISTEK